MISYDSETFPIEPGIPAPKGVIGSWWDGDDGLIEWHADSLVRLEQVLITNELLALANGAFDFAVALRDRPDLIDLIFSKYERGEVWECFVGMALHAIAEGHLFLEADGSPMQPRNAQGKREGKANQRYNLTLIAWQVLGIANSKANDEYKLRYRELIGIPFEQWPESARQYPIDDARDTWQIADKQQVFKNQGMIIRYIPGTSPSDPATFSFGWTHHTHHARAAFAMHLASVWGLRCNAADTEKLAAQVEADTKDQIIALINGGKALIKNEEGIKEEITVLGGCLKTGYVTKNKRVPNPAKPGKTMYQVVTEFDAEEYGKENRRVIKRRVVVAYGGNEDGLCPTCNGAGEIKSPRSNADVTCGEYFRITEPDAEGKSVERWSDHNEARKTCDGTGLRIPYTVPRSDGGGVSFNRDCLEESNDPDLELLAEIGPLETVRDRFIPWLREGARIPLNTRPNVLVETTRASYDGIIQTLPRKHGVRECVEAREGYVFCSVDYNALELSTLAQVCLWVVGYSMMGKAINEKKDLHSVLAAQMTSAHYDPFLARVKAEEQQATDFRQAAKAGNFGFGGMMGAAKFTLTQRKNGLRMCRLMGREPIGGCGSEKIYEWKKRPCAPSCAACVQCSAELKSAWGDTWFEMKEYFGWITGLPGMDDEEHRDSGIIVSPGTGFIRSKISAPSAANHCFQHLAAMGAKHALWNVSRECYVRKLGSPLYGSRVVLFLHDELIAEVPKSVAHWAGYRMAEVMVNSMREFVPDVHVGAEPALMTRWFKAAKAVHDPVTKLLVPWYPKGWHESHPQLAA